MYLATITNGIQNSTAFATGRHAYVERRGEKVLVVGAGAVCALITLEEAQKRLATIRRNGRLQQVKVRDWQWQRIEQFTNGKAA